MTLDEYLTARPTLRRWNNGIPEAEPRRALQNTKHQARKNLNFFLKFFFEVGIFIKSESRPTALQLQKRAAKLLIVIRVTIKPAVCRTTFMLTS